MAKKKIAPEDRVFDRLPEFDEKSKAFPVRTLFTKAQLAVPRSYTWRHVQLDQGAEGACTGFSACMEAAARPAPLFGNPPIYTITQINAFARKWYKAAQDRDQWPGSDYDGSSVLGACKAGMDIGVWTQYRWADFDDLNRAVDEIIASLGYNGPVMMGTDWMEGMLRADYDGYLNPTGQVVGGHAWLLTAYSRTRDAAWTPNSWGGEGQGWLSRQSLITLLSQGGEACIPVRRSTTKLDPTKITWPAAA